MLSIILVFLGIAITVIGAYSVLGLGIRITDGRLFRSKTVTDIVLPGLILLFILFTILLWAVIYRIHIAFGL